MIDPRQRKTALMAFVLPAALFVLAVMLSSSFVANADTTYAPLAQATQPPRQVNPDKPTADHTKFDILKQTFATGPDVTKACLTCHTEAADQLHKTTHWTWEYKNPQTGQLVGKKNVINNFCIALETNEARCTSCHIGYGWKDDTFNFASKENVDCLVCHDTTGTYKKFPSGAGHPVYKDTEFPAGSGVIWKPLNLAAIAQKVGKTSTQTCGTCHFSGGGGDSVKHGDLDPTLNKADKNLDVHMDKSGLNFTCATCHQPTNHNIPGSRYTTVAKDTHGIDVPGDTDLNRATCESCHGSAPHKLDIQINGHVNKVACETCHIPTVAKEDATKVSWDWSTAGKKAPDGKLIQVKDPATGHITYDTQKGDFIWVNDYVPELVWFNGKTRYSTVADNKIDVTKLPVKVNELSGSYADADSRIWPVKRFVAKQPYDSVNNSLIVPHLFGTDDNAYWKAYDWNKALTAGATASGQNYSGKYGFVDTEMYWVQTHMVAPKEQAVACESCHTKAPDGRLAKLTDFYLPGRDASPLLDGLGIAAIGLTIVGAGVHGLTRKNKSNAK
jgi:octaheme c-type cytochrome (tetrathionate reductase family)